MDRIRTAFLVTLFLILVGVSSSAGAPTAYTAFVANLADGVSVINTATNSVVATVTQTEGLGVGPFGVAITPNGAFAYVVNLTSNDVSVINTATNPPTVLRTVAVGVAPFGVAITPNGAFAYVTVFGDRCMNGGVWVIDTAKVKMLDPNPVVTIVPVPGCTAGVAITPDGAFAYVANSTSSTVTVIDTSTNSKFGDLISVGSSPYGVAITPDGRFAYVTNSNSNSISVIDTAKVKVLDPNPVVATVAVGASPQGVAVTPDGAFAYVANFTPSDTPVIGNVSVIDTTKVTGTTENPVVATVAVGVGPSGVAITPDGAFAYVTNSNSNSISVIETVGNTVVATTEVGAGPRGIAIAKVDTTPPDTSIVSGPSEGSPTNSPQATFTFSGTDDRTQTTELVFNCSLDGAAFITCISPQTYTGLAGGQHAFAVRAVDAAGNVDATPAARTWTVDTIPPDTSLSSGPAEGSVTASVQATFTFAGTDDQTTSSALTFTCSLDGGTAAVCASPQTYTGLAGGQHAFAVGAVDAAGNTDPSPATRTWTVDTTPPDTSFLNGLPEGSVTNSTQATFTFVGTDNQTASSSITFTCSLDGVTSAVCASPQTYMGISEGRHTFAVAAIDAAGNTDPTPAERTWTVDTTAPTLSVTVNPQALWPPNHQLVEVTVAVSAGDQASVVLSKVECSEPAGVCAGDDIQGADIGTLDTTILLRSTRTGGSERTYTLTYQATDLAGNTVTASATVVVPAKSP